MGTKKNVDMTMTEVSIKKVEATDKKEKKSKKTKTKIKKTRSANYLKARAMVNKNKKYDPFSAIELIKKTSYSNFEGTISAHIQVKEVGHKVEIAFPHSTGKTRKVAIVDDKVLKEIESGNYDYDILLSSPEYMPKIAKYARDLGPKGLMPNPKNGTLTANPELKKKELEAGKFLLKTEKKAPLMHVVIGKTSMDTKELLKNLQYLIKQLKNKIKKMSIAASMSPGVKIDISAVEIEPKT